jgi:hypothetical protein
VTRVGGGKSWGEDGRDKIWGENGRVTRGECAVGGCVVTKKLEFFQQTQKP